MKKTCLTMLLAGAGLGADAQIAHWNFNGNANDATPNAIHGTAINCTYVAGTSGTANTAIKFNGMSSMVDVPYHPATGTAKFTIRAVLRVDAFNTAICEGNAIFIQQSPSEEFRKALLITDNMYNDCGNYNPADMRFQFAAHGADPNPASAQQYSGGINIGQWYCVIATYDGINRKIYIDGVLKHSNPYPNQFVAAQAPISIGYFSGGLLTGYPYYFNGAIDDIALYDYAVQDSGISELCKAFKPGTTGAGDLGGQPKSRPEPYPNPAVEVLNVPVQGAAGSPVTVAVYGPEGRLLRRESVLRNGASTIQLSTSSLAPGCYLVEVIDAAGRATKPFTKR